MVSSSSSRGAFLKGDQVPVDGCGVFSEFLGDRSELVAVTAGGLGMVCLDFGDGAAD
jgi:hypothetical protein